MRVPQKGGQLGQETKTGKSTQNHIPYPKVKLENHPKEVLPTQDPDRRDPAGGSPALLASLLLQLTVLHANLAVPTDCKPAAHSLQVSLDPWHGGKTNMFQQCPSLASTCWAGITAPNA